MSSNSSSSNKVTELRPDEACSGGGKHHWMHSLFCDRCDMDFDTRYTKVIEEVRKKTCESLLTALRSILNEQQSTAYIYSAVKEDAKRKGWIED